MLLFLVGQVILAGLAVGDYGSKYQHKPSVYPSPVYTTPERVNPTAAPVYPTPGPVYHTPERVYPTPAHAYPITHKPTYPITHKPTYKPTDVEPRSTFQKPSSVIPASMHKHGAYPKSMYKTPSVYPSSTHKPTVVDFESTLMEPKVVLRTSTHDKPRFSQKDGSAHPQVHHQAKHGDNEVVYPLGHEEDHSTADDEIEEETE